MAPYRYWLLIQRGGGLGPDETSATSLVNMQGNGAKPGPVEIGLVDERVALLCTLIDSTLLLTGEAFFASPPFVPIGA